MNIVVNVSDLKVSNDLSGTLATYSLGSCIGVTAYDSAAHVGGMLHFQLPSATADPQRAGRNPLMFADSGMQCMLQELDRCGANRRRLKVKLAGAAQILNDNNLFNIGRRNHAAVRKILWQLGLFVDGEDIGGNSPRNMYLNIADGSVMVKSQGKEMAL